MSASPRFRASRGLVSQLGGLAIVGSMLWACSGDQAEARSQATRIALAPDSATQAAAAIDAFGFDLFRSDLTSGGNAVVSPTSIVLALSMAQAGARGDTAAQMDAVLHSALGAGAGNGINSLDQDLAQLSGTFKDAKGTPQQVVVRIANSPFAQSGLQLEQPLLDTLASKYGAGLRLADFENDPTGACKLIDGWVSDQTGGRIPQLLDRVDPQTRLVLVNAIYLKAAWQIPFDATATKDLPFTRLDGTQVSVPTMGLQLSEGRYASGRGWQAVDLPYADGSLAYDEGSLSMTIVLPDNMATFKAGLDAAAFSQIADGMQSTNVSLALPRFKIETKTDLAAALTRMGMPLAFDPTGADFSGITKQNRLHISKVIHQANVSIDEKGTEASAATAVVFPLSAAGREATFHVDRPFMFAVRDTRTGAILFLGRVADPSA